MEIQPELPCRTGSMWDYDTEKYITDERVSKCKLATKSCWYFWIKWIVKLGTKGRLTGSIEKLAEWGKCKTEDAVMAVSELEAIGVIDVWKKQDKTMTLVCVAMVVDSKVADEDEAREAVRRNQVIRKTIPTLADVVAECVLRGYLQSEGEAFYAYWESVGWITGSGVYLADWRMRLKSQHEDRRARFEFFRQQKGRNNDQDYNTNRERTLGTVANTTDYKAIAERRKLNGTNLRNGKMGPT